MNNYDLLNELNLLDNLLSKSESKRKRYSSEEKFDLLNEFDFLNMSPFQIFDLIEVEALPKEFKIIANSFQGTEKRNNAIMKLRNEYRKKIKAKNEREEIAFEKKLNELNNKGPKHVIAELMKKDNIHGVIAEFGNGKNNETDIEDESLDAAVYCLSILGKNKKNYFKEGYRMLKHGGVLYVAEVTENADQLIFICHAIKCGFELELFKEIGKFTYFKYVKD